MKKYLVVGKPINHSLSPKLHNFWIKKNNINAIYDKREIEENKIGELVLDLKKGDIDGINVTLPFKKSVIPFLDELSLEANETQSVNTIYKDEKNKIIGHNTDIAGFELGFKKINFEMKNKKIFILGAGGVAPSIILALRKMNVGEIILSNRTQKKAEDLKKINPKLQIKKWGEFTDFDVIINLTSIGLKKNEEIKIDHKNIGSNKLFYDVIYNPTETKFLLEAKKFGHKIENGKMMFIYQAHQAFTIWHKVMPKINDEVLKLFD